jgi:hypothetical protein
MDQLPHHALGVDDIRACAALRTDMSKDWRSYEERFRRYPLPAWFREAIGAVIVVSWPKLENGFGFRRGPQPFFLISPPRLPPSAS